MLGEMNIYDSFLTGTREKPPTDSARNPGYMGPAIASVVGDQQHVNSASELQFC